MTTTETNTRLAELHQQLATVHQEIAHLHQGLAPADAPAQIVRETPERGFELLRRISSEAAAKKALKREERDAKRALTVTGSANGMLQLEQIMDAFRAKPAATPTPEQIADSILTDEELEAFLAELDAALR
jgi:hypothetical protein